LLDERKPLGVREFKRHAEKLPKGVRITSPISIQHWLEFAERQNWIRKDNTPSIHRGTKASIYLTPQGRVHAEGRRNIEYGELDLLKTGGFQTLVDPDKSIFVYSKLPLEIKRTQRIKDLENRLNTALERLTEEYGSQWKTAFYEKSKVNWTAWDEDRTEFLERRSNIEQLSEKRRRKRCQDYPREVVAFAKKLSKLPFELTDKLVRKKLEHVRLGEVERRELLDLRKRRYEAKVVVEMKTEEQPFAVLVGNHHFTEALIYPPGRLIQKNELGRPYLHVDEFVRRLTTKQLSIFEQACEEAAHSNGSWPLHSIGDGYPVGEIQSRIESLSDKVGLDLPYDVFDKPSIRRSYFLKLLAAVKAELRHRVMPEGSA
jgi:hypothetical protein